MYLAKRTLKSHIRGKKGRLRGWGFNRTHMNNRERVASLLSEAMTSTGTGTLHYQKMAEALGVLSEMENIDVKYHELLWAVANKYPNESRHETALRYIRQAERVGDATAIAGKLMNIPHENPCQGECKICEYIKELR